jgi:hypothetical protein
LIVDPTSMETQRRALSYADPLLWDYGYKRASRKAASINYDALARISYSRESEKIFSQRATLIVPNARNRK